MQLIKYGAAMSFAYKEKLNELVIFCCCCSAANLWVLTLSRLSITEEADILHEPHGSNIWGLGPHEVGTTNAELSHRLPSHKLSM